MVIVYSIVNNGETTHAVEELHAVCTNEFEAEKIVDKVKVDHPFREVHTKTVEVNKYNANSLLD